MCHQEKEKLTFSLLCTLAWGIAAHGYCYFNLLYSHDSLLVYQHDTRLQLNIGRFMHLVYWKLRGNFYPPALVGFLSLVFLGLAVYLIAQLFHMERKWEIALTSGILTTNTAMALLNATYIHEIDIYMLAMLCATGAVFLCRNRKWGCIPGALLICCSMGMYQCFFEVAVVLFMLLAILDILKKEALPKVIRDGCIAIGMLLIGLVLYLIAMRLSLAVTHTEIGDSYNSPSSAMHFTGFGQILGSFLGSYRFVFRKLVFSSSINPLLHKAAVLPCLVILAACLIALIIRQRIRGWDLVVLIILAALLPFGMNVIFFIAGGEAHDLMTYPFFLIYILALLLLREMSETLSLSGWKKIIPYSVPVLIGIMMFENVIFSNQAYLKKDLEYRNTQSVMTRILGRMEQTEGFVIGETPIIFDGRLGSNPLFADREGLDVAGTGLKYNSSVTYEDTLNWYMDYVVAYPNPILLPDEPFHPELVEKMPVFPATGSCQMIDGIMVVKLSDKQ